MGLDAASLLWPVLLVAAAPKEAGRALPSPDVRLTIDAPSPHEPWTMRVANEGEQMVRIAADGRLLRLEIKPRAGGRPVRCALPRPLRPSGFPEARSLYLAPGDAYVELIEPELTCFGAREAGALEPGAEVRATLGWPKAGPFVVEGLRWPPEIASQHAITSPPVEIGEAARPAVSPPPEDGGGDERAPRLAIDAPRFLDAASAFGLTMRVVARNVGHRPMRVVLRPRMVGFEVDGPDGPRECEVATGEHDATPPGLFRTLAPGAATTLAVRVGEVCGNDVFQRPGLYRVRVTLHADETGTARGVPAYTGHARAPEVTLVRVRSGPRPFHRELPGAALVHE